MTPETITRSVPDPLYRWVPVPIARKYRVGNSGKPLLISIRTNSDLLFQSLILFQQGELCDSQDEADFSWEIVFEQEDADALSDSMEISVLSAESMCTAYFGRKSFFSITPRQHYAAGFLSLPSGELLKKNLIEEYLALLVHLTKELVSSSKSDSGKELLS